MSDYSNSDGRLKDFLQKYAKDNVDMREELFLLLAAEREDLGKNVSNKLQKSNTNVLSFVITVGVIVVIAIIIASCLEIAFT